MPDETIDHARDELEATVRSVPLPDGATVRFEYTSPRDHPVGGAPSQIAADHPGVVALSSAFERQTGAPADMVGFAAWSEIPFLAQAFGTAGVYFAPGDLRSCHTPEEHVNVSDVLTATRVLARFISEYCGVDG